MMMLMFLIPILFLLSEFFLMKMILPRLYEKTSYRYFDRTTWVIILMVTTVFGYLFYMYVEERDQF